MVKVQLRKLSIESFKNNSGMIIFINYRFY